LSNGGALDPETEARIRQVRDEAGKLSEEKVTALAAAVETEAGRDGGKLVLEEARRIAADAVRQARQVTALLGELSRLLGDDEPGGVP
jgi:hypothetical protein